MLYGETLDQKAERSNSTMHKIKTRVTTVTTSRVVQLMPRLTHQSSAQLMITGTMISSCNEFALLPLEHDPEKHALGLDPRVGTGFPKRSCSKKASEASPQTDEACGFCGSDRRLMTSSGKTSLKDR